MRIAVLGVRGQLGAAVAHELAAGHDVKAFDRAALDITDAAAVMAAMASARPEVIVNAAGFNTVDAAEDRPLDALHVNAFAVRSLARAARAQNAALVHYGSDFVFDGTAVQPHTEDDRPNPRSVYAASKLLGEWFAADAPTAYVLRVESLFGNAPGAAPKGSAAVIIEGLREGTRPKVFEDRTVSPTYVADAARVTREIIERRLPAGLYHCVNSGTCTWLEFALEAARLLGVDPEIERIRLQDIKLRAPRPLYCALSNARLVSLGIQMPTWQDALRRHISQLVR